MRVSHKANLHKRTIRNPDGYSFNNASLSNQGAAIAFLRGKQEALIAGAVVATANHGSILSVTKIKGLQIGMRFCGTGEISTRTETNLARKLT